MMRTFKLLSAGVFLSVLSLTSYAGELSPKNDLVASEKSPFKRFHKFPRKEHKVRKFGDSATSTTGHKDIRTFQKAPRNRQIMREVPSYYFSNSENATTADTTPFKPSVSVGSIVHMFASYQQNGYGSHVSSADASNWKKGFTLYRARVLVGGQLSRKGSFFFETDIPSPIGIRVDSTTKNVKVSPIILDAQYEHKFSDAFQLISGMQLVSHNRNGLQGAAGLMANDFTYFQYPYNLFANSPLQGNFGRDLGVNARGYVLNNRLEYRLGVFTGNRFSNDAPLRTVGRVVYNFLDPEKDYYYAGTKLGEGKTLALGAGFDAQATYHNVGADLFVDVPVGPGSVTLNSAFTYMTGGTKLNTPNTFANRIPQQTIQYLELGYYLKGLKIQPWIRYENQNINSKTEQTGGRSTSEFDKQNSSTVFGGGINYFFNGYGTNLRLSYTSYATGVLNLADGTISKKSYGQFWLQLQFFVF